MWTKYVSSWINQNSTIMKEWRYCFPRFIATVPKHFFNEVKKTQKAFFWNNSSPKIKHETLCNDYKAGELKNVDIPNKIITHQCSWIRWLYDNYCHEWKLIRLYLIRKSFSLYLNFIQTYFLKVIKPSFSPLSIGELFWSGKNVFLWLVPFNCKFVLDFTLFIDRKQIQRQQQQQMVTETPCILSQYLW